MNKEKIVIASGYFDPIHVGHLEYLKMANELGDKLVVIINNDEQATLKKGKPFMAEKDRLEIVYHLDMVDEVILACDETKSVCETIRMVHRFKPMNKLIFCNGGDRDASNSPEVKVCSELGIEFVQNLGKKIRSSSEMTGLIEYDTPANERY